MVNKATIKVGISIILAGAVLTTLGVLAKFAHENCMEMTRAFERGESGTTPICPTDESSQFLIPAIPVGIAGVVILLMGRRGLSLLPPSRSQSR